MDPFYNLQVALPIGAVKLSSVLLYAYYNAVYLSRTKYSSVYLSILQSRRARTYVHAAQVSIELCPVCPLESSTQPKVAQLDVTLQSWQIASQ